MNVILAIMILVLLCSDTATSLWCNYCRNVHPETNVCKHLLRRCNAGEERFCYSRMITRAGDILRLERGCTGRCISVRHKYVLYQNKFTICCDSNYCNRHPVFQFDRLNKYIISRPLRISKKPQ